jgi:putative ABC transport system permease protein
VGLTVASIALSVALLLGVERIRREAESSFTSTISGTDLIVGARTSPVQLLLASVFRLSDVSNTIDWKSHDLLAKHPAVAWTIPVSLGDSHRGYRVLGTTRAYLDHYRYGRRESLRLVSGVWFDASEGAVLGADVARILGYKVGDPIVVAHGAGAVSFIEHDEHPFKVTGILAPTGTPVDRTVHVSLAGIDAMHAEMNVSGGSQGHDPLAAAMAKVKELEEHDHDHNNDHEHDHDHDHAGAGKLTAVFVGLKSRAMVLGVQRMVNEHKDEALTAVMPADALQQLWEIVAVVENTLLAVSGFVVAVGLCGMMVAIMTSLNERRREMAILRSVGARPIHVFGLIVGEAVLMTASGAMAGLGALYGLLWTLRPVVATRFGLFLDVGLPTGEDMVVLAAVCLAGILIGLVPGYRSYRYSLADGLTVRL